MARGTKYATAEDLRLARAIVAAARSRSAVVDNVKHFWTDVYSHFVTLGEAAGAIDFRSPNGVEQHWHSVADNVRRFAQLYEAAMLTSVNHESAIATACTKYVHECGRVFKHLEVWQYLRDEAPMSYQYLLTVHPRVLGTDMPAPRDKPVTDCAPAIEPTQASDQEPSGTSGAAMAPVETPVATMSRVSGKTTATKKRKVIDFSTARLAQRQRKNELLAQHNELLRQLVEAQSTMAHAAVFADAPVGEREAAAALQRRVVFARLEKEARALGLDVANSNR